MREVVSQKYGGPYFLNTSTKAARQYMKQQIAKLHFPGVFAVHSHFRTAWPKDLLFNLIRHPLKAAVSLFYFVRFGHPTAFIEMQKHLVTLGQYNSTYDECVARKFQATIEIAGAPHQPVWPH